MRPTKEEYYMAISQLASLRSTCLSRKVGAVIVKDDNPISFGFNGPARGVEHCEDLGGCRRRTMADYASGKYLELCVYYFQEKAVNCRKKNSLPKPKRCRTVSS